MAPKYYTICQQYTANHPLAVALAKCENDLYIDEDGYLVAANPETAAWVEETCGEMIVLDTERVQ